MLRVPRHSFINNRLHRSSGADGKLRAAISAGLLAATLLLGGCVSELPRPQPVSYDPDLISGVRVFGEEVAATEVPAAALVDVPSEMAAYLDENVKTRRLSVARFKRLFAALNRDGYFDSTYSADETYNAGDTFRLKAGNCLSYTNMFIAMSRYVGLNAQYQVVDVPPSWDADSGYLIRYTHINVLMRGVRLDKAGSMDFTVDFNSVHPEPDYATRVVSDRYAEALFHANLSVDMVRRGEPRKGFAHIRRAIEATPYNPDLWINLGAFYAKNGNYDAAIESYQVALSIDDANKGAMAGLSRAYIALGNEALGEHYASQVRKYRERNPYYHFALAQARFDIADYQAALESINLAIDLKGRNGRFYFMKGLTEQKLGLYADAEQSFRRAERFGRFRDLKLRYVNEFAGVSNVSFDLN